VQKVLWEFPRARWMERSMRRRFTRLPCENWERKQEYPVRAR
jgi:hypothetical protein